MLKRGAGIKNIVQDMIRRADTARDEGRFQHAAFLYAEASLLAPERPGLRVQYGHMLKELGQYDEAEVQYKAAARLRPRDADLALQMGHFYKIAGRVADAQNEYQRAVALKPGWNEPQEELAWLREAGLFPSTRIPAPGTRTEEAACGGERSPTIAEQAELAGELAPRGRAGLEPPPLDQIEIRRLGRDERTFWGRARTLRGIEAIRGYYLSLLPIVEVKFLINGRLVYRGRPRGGYPLAPEFGIVGYQKYVFNAWFDFSSILPGRYEFQVELVDAQRRSAIKSLFVVVAPPISEGTYPDSDGVITLDNIAGRSLEDQINSRPSMVRSGRRRLLPKDPKAVLVQRTDQLGDLVVALPALHRIRQMFPKAHLVGLVSPANAGLAATFGVFDDLITVDFSEDRSERRRTMALEDQAALRNRLAPFGFDIAIDLSENMWSRPLLLLSGAPFLVGFRGGDVPLDVDLEGNTHDRWDNHEVVPHTNKLLGLVEWLAAMLRSEPNLLPRQDFSVGVLSDLGLSATDEFVVLHDGARLQFSRWPHYQALAEMLLQTEGLRVVWITDDPGTRGRLPEALLGHDRFRLLDERPSFDAFDTLLASCAVFVGNDSGPKHLASLRGAKVVSLHMARNNWNEWGQENGGYIISRKVPCAGCLIHYDGEECGKDFVCIRGIKPEEVFGAVQKLL